MAEERKVKKTTKEANCTQDVEWVKENYYLLEQALQSSRYHLESLYSLYVQYNHSDFPKKAVAADIEEQRKAVHKLSKKMLKFIETFVHIDDSDD